MTEDEMPLPRRGPQQANRRNSATKGVPMGRIPWQTQEAGHFEVDLVHHCGGTTAGEYAHTLQMVDGATGWSERVAVLGRGQGAMQEGFIRIKERVPFAIKELHPDNGPEFFNDHMVRFWGEELTGLSLSRSRPYHKNDNRWVEQKNDTLVRAYLGHGRLDTHRQVEALNELYDLMWIYYNLFQPVLHLTEKTYTEDTAKVGRGYHTIRAVEADRGAHAGASAKAGLALHAHQSQSATHGSLQATISVMALAGSG